MTNVDTSDSFYKVMRGKDGRWEVRDPVRVKPLARFDRMSDAMQYAHDMLAEQRRMERLSARRVTV
jgi:hypothetical protein